MGVLPGSMKRRQFGSYLAAHWARVTALGEPSAIALVFALTAAFRGRRSLRLRPRRARLQRIEPPAQRPPRLLPLLFRTVRPDDSELRRLYEGFERRGTQTTGDFAGRYLVFKNGAPRRTRTSTRASRFRRTAS